MMRRHDGAACVGLALALALPLVLAVSAPRVAFAQRDPAVERSLLLAEAQRARDAGDHLRALEAAQQAGALQMTPSVRTFITQEQDVLGRSADALRSAHHCLIENGRDPSNRNFARIQQTCEALVDDLRGRVGTLRLNFAGGAPPPNVVVTVDGVPLTNESVSDLVLVDAGRRVLTVEAPGYLRRLFAVQVVAGRTVAQDLVLERAPLAAPIERVPPVETPIRRAPSGARAFPVGPVVTLGVGGVLAALAPVFFALRESALDEVRLQCTGSETPSGSPSGGWSCVAFSEREVPAWGTAVSMNTATNVSLIAGSALLVGGAVWLVLDRTLPRAAPERVTVAPSPLGATLTVRF